MNRQLVSRMIGCFLAVLAATAQAATLVTDSHQAISKNQRFEAVGYCVRAVQEYWHENNYAKLALKKRGRTRIENEWRIVTIDGWVWHNGERVSVSHECASQGRNHSFAMNVTLDGQTALATVTAQSNLGSTK